MNISEDLDDLINRQIDAEDDLVLASNNLDEARRQIEAYAQKAGLLESEIVAMLVSNRKQRSNK